VRLRNLAVFCTPFLLIGSLSVIPAWADGTTASTLYVQSTGCSDSGSGTQALPFCTIQAAANAASPGQTVSIAPGNYDEDVHVTRSGSPGAPISFVGPPVIGLLPKATVGGSDVAHGFELSNVHDIVINGFGVSSGTGASLLVSGSQDVVINQVGIGASTNGASLDGVDIAGASSNVTVSRSTITPEGVGVSIGAGVSGAIVSTNAFGYRAVLVSGAADTAITSNEGEINNSTCQTEFSVTGAATGTSIENNIFQIPCTGSTPVVSVSADSAGSTKLDYNIVHGSLGSALYSWSGATYTSAPQLQAATGQGAHDLNGSFPIGTGGVPAELSAAIDSADANAPGELSTDLHNNSRVDDPLVSNTGTGPGYFDRGAVERPDELKATTSLSATQAPTGGVVTATIAAAAGWASITSYSVDFGDGTAPVSSTAPTISHSYANNGTYTVTATTVDNTGYRATAAQVGITIVTPVPLVVHATPSQYGGKSISIDASATTDSWNTTQISCDFGDGSPVAVGPGHQCSHRYVNSGTYSVTVAMTDAGGNTASQTFPFTTAGSDYVPLGPTRLLDTRTGLGGILGAVRSGQTVRLQIAGTAGVPSGITAVALNITAADTVGSGVVTAYPDGAARPQTSNLNYVQGQVVPNFVIVPVGTDGTVDLYDFGGGTADLIADLNGYFIRSAGDGYQTVSPARILDTRNGTGTGGTAAKVGPHQTLTLTVAGADGEQVPSSGVAAIALNVTVADTTSSGFVSVYPDGIARPSASNLNFVAGQVVPNMVIAPVGSDGKIDFYNSGPGTINLVADAQGFFASNATQTRYTAYVPLGPTRILDTRTGTGGVPVGPMPARSTMETFPSLVPANVPVGSWVLNTTVTQGTQPGFLIVYPADSGQPNTSNANWSTAETVADLGAIQADGGVGLEYYNGGGGTAQVISDVFGYFG
jgi:hypothetical protein